MGDLREVASPPTDVVSSLRFSPSGKFLAVASWDRTVRLYARSDSDGDTAYTSTGRPYEFRAPLLDICWGPNDDWLFAVGLDYDVRRLNLPDGEQNVLSTHGAASNKVAYSNEQNLLLSTSWDGTLHVHRNPTSASAGDVRFTRIRLAEKPFALSLTKEKAVVAMAARKESVYDLRALEMLAEQTAGTSSLEDIQDVEPWQRRESSLLYMTRTVACMPDGTGFAVSSIEGRVGVEWFDPEQQKNSYAFKCHRQVTKVPAQDGENGGETEEVHIVYPVNALAFHPIHGTFATGGGDGTVAVWDAQSKRRVKNYPKQAASVAAIDFSPDGKFMAVGISPGFEDGKEDDELDPSLVKVLVKQLGSNELKPKPAK